MYNNHHEYVKIVDQTHPSTVYSLHNKCLFRVISKKELYWPPSTASSFFVTFFQESQLFLSLLHKPIEIVCISISFYWIFHMQKHHFERTSTLTLQKEIKTLTVLNLRSFGQFFTNVFYQIIVCSNLKIVFNSYFTANLWKSFLICLQQADDSIWHPYPWQLQCLIIITKWHFRSIT